LALSASFDGTLRLWDVATGESVRTFTGHTGGVHSCAFSLDGRQALSASADGTLRLWDVATGEPVRTFTGHTGEVHNCAFSPDGRQALSASADRTLRLWDVATGQVLARWLTESPLYCVAYGPDGRLVLAGDRIGGVHFLELIGIQVANLAAPAGPAAEVAPAPKQGLFGRWHRR
jgi:WD40 repeat protein